MNFERCLFAIPVATTLLYASIASAQDTTAWYAGVDYANVTVSKSGYDDVDFNATELQAGWALGSYSGLELSAGVPWSNENIGDNLEQRFEAKLRPYGGVYYRAHFEPAANFSLIGKVGAAYTRFETHKTEGCTEPLGGAQPADLPQGCSTSDSSETSLGLSLGIGAEYRTGPQFSLNVSATMLEEDIVSYSAGFRYSFR